MLGVGIELAFMALRDVGDFQVRVSSVSFEKKVSKYH
jgi:hypothetical protein